MKEKLLYYWFRSKYQTRAKEKGYYHTAVLLRKQGIPLDLALVILF